jgi:hypothetical protein
MPTRLTDRVRALRLRAPFAMLLAAAVLLLPLLAPSAIEPRALASSSSATIVGTFTPTTVPPGVTNYGANAQVFIDNASRVLYTYSTLYHWIAAYDLETLRPLGAGLNTGSDADTDLYIDPAAGGLVLARATVAGEVRLEEYASRNQGVVLVSTLTLTASLPGKLVVGMYKAPDAPKAWLLAGNGYSQSIAPGGVTVVQLTLHGDSLGAATVDWTQAVAGCPEVMHPNNTNTSGFGYFAATHSLYFGCADASTNNNTSTGHLPSQRGAGQFTLNLSGSLASGTTTPGAFELHPHSGEFAFSNSFFDANAGRLGMGAYSASSGGSTLYTFDAGSSSWVGGVSLGNNEISQDGLDPVSGRYYALSPTAGIGLILADLRPTPVSQGVSVPPLHDYKKQTVVAARLGIDSRARRLFLKYANLEEFVVAQDNQPPYAASANIDPDKNTVNVEESPGKTDAAYLAGAQGYGSLIRQVGGYGAVFTNATGVSSDGVQPVGLGTREFRGSYINALQLTNDEASGDVISADADRSNTKYDLSKTKPPDPNDRPSQLSDVPTPTTTSTSTTSTTLPSQLAPVTSNTNPVVDRTNNPQQTVEWLYNNAQCTDFGDNPGDVSTDGAFAACHTGEHFSHVHATFGRTEASNVVISDSLIDAKTYLDKKLGVVATTHAESRGISVLGGLLKIGQVVVDATSWAKGRPNTADSTYTVDIKNVLLNGNEICTTTCNPNVVAQQVNAAFAPAGFSPSAAVQISFPSYDSTYFHGSKGGYQALIRSSPAAHLQDVTINEHPDDRLEVPGMAIFVSQDNEKPGRTVVLLSGVETEAHYGISVLDDGAFDDENALDALAGGLASGGGPVFGLPTGIAPTDAIGGGGNGTNGLPPTGSTLQRTGRLILNGLHNLGALLPIWALLLVPIYLSARRWLLLQRSTLIGGRS